MPTRPPMGSTNPVNRATKKALAFVCLSLNQGVNCSDLVHLDLSGFEPALGKSGHGQQKSEDRVGRFRGTDSGDLEKDRQDSGGNAGVVDNPGHLGRQVFGRALLFPG